MYLGLSANVFCHIKKNFICYEEIYFKIINYAHKRINLNNPGVTIHNCFLRFH